MKCTGIYSNLVSRVKWIVVFSFWFLPVAIFTRNYGMIGDRIIPLLF